MGTTKRWEQQRWLLDAVIRTVGVDWDQGRSFYLQAPCGPDAFGDFQGIRTRVQRFDDITREFSRAAERRERTARTAETAGHTITARESFYIASVLYGGAQWPIFENSAANMHLNEKKIECYAKYAGYSDHHVERVEIPFGDTSLPGWLHLPSDPVQGRLPCVLLVDGMDGFKEAMVSLHGDRLLSRGLAVLAIDGPGQGECTTRGIHVTGSNWFDAGRAILPWLRARPEVDPAHIAVHGISFGSYWATQLAASGHDVVGCAVALVCHEPGCHTIMETASPTFKMRFMYMAGYEEEDEFDQFIKGFSLRGVGPELLCPYLVIAGERDELSPLEHTYRLLEEVGPPKEMVVYEGEKHGLSATSASLLGPNWSDHVADWIQDRVRGTSPAPSRHLFVDVTGRVHESTWDEVAAGGPGR
jgi:dienelactone hydrolase